MAFRWRWFLILLALALSGEWGFAANTTKEQRAYTAAARAFQDAMWSRAETEFAQFAQKYPKSTNTPPAVLLQAQAQFKQGKLKPAIDLLNARMAQAGNLADQYVYWIGEAQFQNKDFSAAAETFISLAQNFLESPLRLRAVVESASSYAQLAEWPQVAALLQATNGVFQRAGQMDSGNELVARGRSLLAQAKFVQNDFSGAAAVLESLNAQPLAPELDWQRAYLLCRVKLAANDLDTALAVTTNLLQIAGKNDGWRATSVALRADVLEKMGRTNEAMAAYQENLTNAPDQSQRQAVLKIAELSIGQKQFANAEQSLEKFLAQFPGSASADIAMFTLGELHLRDYVASRDAGPATNHLQQATAAFDLFLGVFTNNLFTGKAYLDRGWCNWFLGENAENLGDFKNAAQKITESFDDFKMAARRLPLLEDLAVARFKMGDALFVQKDFLGARTNYQAVLDDFSSLPDVEKALGEQALYQKLRACLELNDDRGASDALAQIFQRYPAGELAQSSSLLYGESLTSPAEARSLFEKIASQFSGSALEPQLRLAVARTYELEQAWPSAITQYENWLTDFPTNSLQPQAAYARAWANFQAGNETNAFRLFTNFTAQFPTDANAPLAQYWVAEHFYRTADFVNAERNYKTVFQNTNWQGSPLVYPAQMMAGRAAVGRLGYSDAIGYFKALAADTNCPPELDGQARFAWGGALMLSDPTDPNNPLANFQSATNVFGQVCRLYPTNELGALAGIEIGKCASQLTNYDAATNAYAQVFNSPIAGIAARSQAQIGFGLVLEKKAALAAGADSQALLQSALDDYLDVFYETNLRGEEMADAFWIKKAGLLALPLVQLPGVADPEKFIDHMEELFPQLKDSLEKKKADLPPAKK
jgi:TolA-binding protein